MRLAMPEGPRWPCKIIAAIGMVAMTVPWIISVAPWVGAALFDGGIIASGTCLVLLLTNVGQSI